MPKLVINGSVHELTEGCVTIGRAPDNAIVLDEPSVSSHHAELRLTGETCILKDLGSTNGTRVNGVPMAETALRFNDRIRFGAAEARYESDARGSQAMPALEEILATPAESSAIPVDFGNASPFPCRQKQKDPIRNTLVAAAAAALLTFIGSMIAVLMMYAPAP